MRARVVVAKSTKPAAVKTKLLKDVPRTLFLLLSFGFVSGAGRKLSAFSMKGRLKVSDGLFSYL